MTSFDYDDEAVITVDAVRARLPVGDQASTYSDDVIQMVIDEEEAYVVRALGSLRDQALTRPRLVAQLVLLTLQYPGLVSARGGDFTRDENSSVQYRGYQEQRSRLLLPFARF